MVSTLQALQDSFPKSNLTLRKPRSSSPWRLCLSRSCQSTIQIHLKTRTIGDAGWDRVLRNSDLKNPRMALHLDFETLQVDRNLKGHRFYATCLERQHFLTPHKIEGSLTGVFWTEMGSLSSLEFDTSSNGILKVFFSLKNYCHSSYLLSGHSGCFNTNLGWTQLCYFSLMLAKCYLLYLMHYSFFLYLWGIFLPSKIVTAFSYFLTYVLLRSNLFFPTCLQVISVWFNHATE